MYKQCLVRARKDSEEAARDVEEICPAGRW